MPQYNRTCPDPYPRPFLLSAFLAPGCGERLLSRNLSTGAAEKNSSYVSFDAALTTNAPTPDRLLGCKTSTAPPLQNAEQEACDAYTTMEFRVREARGQEPLR